MLVAPTAANARKVGAALAEFGFTKLGTDWAWFQALPGCSAGSLSGSTS